MGGGGWRLGGGGWRRGGSGRAVGALSLLHGLQQAKVDGSTLDRAQKEAENFLQLDVWSRYEEWAKGEGKVGKKTAATESIIEYDDKDVGKMREATAQVQLT